MIAKVRAFWNEVKERILGGSIQEALPVIEIVTILLVGVGLLIVSMIVLAIFTLVGLQSAWPIIAIITFATEMVLLYNKELFTKLVLKTMLLTDFLFGKYGKVLTKSDWKRIRRDDNEWYKFVLSKKSCGFCYYCSWRTALYIKDAKVMYCSIDSRKGPTGHAVIVKNNRVYDTNKRRHFEYDEYIKLFNVHVYKMFSYGEYAKQSFFDDIRQGFVEWCAENHVYCDPE